MAVYLILKTLSFTFYCFKNPANHNRLPIPISGVRYGRIRAQAKTIHVEQSSKW